MLPLGHILNSFEYISYHCYADAIQLHMSFKPQNVATRSILYSFHKELCGSKLSVFEYKNLKFWSVHPVLFKNHLSDVMNMKQEVFL